jgi:hypothetical protein
MKGGRLLAELLAGHVVLGEVDDRLVEVVVGEADGTLTLAFAFALVGVHALLEHLGRAPHQCEVMLAQGQFQGFGIFGHRNVVPLAQQLCGARLHLGHVLREEHLARLSLD